MRFPWGGDGFFCGEIEAAVDQQGAATREKLPAICSRADDRSKDVNKSIVSVKRASEEASGATAPLLDAAKGLSSQSEQLKSEVDGFLSSLQAA